MQLPGEGLNRLGVDIALGVGAVEVALDGAQSMRSLPASSRSVSKRPPVMRCSSSMGGAGRAGRHIRYGGVAVRGTDAVDFGGGVHCQRGEPGRVVARQAELDRAREHLLHLRSVTVVNVRSPIDRVCSALATLMVSLSHPGIRRPTTRAMSARST